MNLACLIYYIGNRTDNEIAINRDISFRFVFGLKK